MWLVSYISDKRSIQHSAWWLKTDAEKQAEVLRDYGYISIQVDEMPDIQCEDGKYFV